MLCLALRTGKRLLQTPPHQGNARARHLLAERCGDQRVRLEHDPLSLVLEAAADDEERSTEPPGDSRALATTVSALGMMSLTGRRRPAPAHECRRGLPRPGSRVGVSSPGCLPRFPDPVWSSSGRARLRAPRLA